MSSCTGIASPSQWRRGGRGFVAVDGREGGLGDVKGWVDGAES